MSTDWVKPALSLIGTILLVLLCVEIIAGPEGTTANIIFAISFLILLTYAIARFFKKKK